MLRTTFLHIRGIGPKTECQLWKRGIHTWDDFLGSAPRQPTLPLPNSSDIWELPPSSRIANSVLHSVEALNNGDIAFFGESLPDSDKWRVYEDFRSATGFLDIETTGLSRKYHRITLVGLYSQGEYKVYFPWNDNDGDALAQDLRKCSVIATFNGTLFDIPFLQHALPDLAFPPVHLDLRFLCRKVGLTGGLKRIENTLGLQRAPGGASGGREAVELWYRFVHGDRSALKNLVRYNHDDTVGLEVIADHVVAQLKSRLTGTANARTTTAITSDCPPHGPTDRRVQKVLDKLETLNPPRSEVYIKQILDHIQTGYQKPRVVGIDLTGSESKHSGWASLSGTFTETRRIKTDEELISATLDAKPDVVSIDSPLSLPQGTVLNKQGTIERYDRIYRDSELELKRRGVSLFWCLLPTMQALTLRGMKLTRTLKENGLQVIESFPGAAQDILAMPRKGKSIAQLSAALAEFGLEGEFVTDLISHDELDAITSGLVGLFYLAGYYEALGVENTDDLIIPRLDDLK